jgi:LAS superfamily LD-carboxypeptidase LdcB
VSAASPRPVIERPSTPSADGHAQVTGRVVIKMVPVPGHHATGRTSSFVGSTWRLRDPSLTSLVHTDGCGERGAAMNPERHETVNGLVPDPSYPAHFLRSTSVMILVPKGHLRPKSGKGTHVSALATSSGLYEFSPKDVPLRRYQVESFQPTRGMHGSVPATVGSRLPVDSAVDLTSSSASVAPTQSGFNRRPASSVLFVPVPVESVGGGRIRDKAAPKRSDVVVFVGAFGRSVALHRLAASALRAMIASARSNGVRSPLLLPVSGFRDPARQARLFAAAVRRYGSPSEARKWVAPPGGSAHQSGRAVDLYLGVRNSSRNVDALRRTGAYQWLVKNAVRFGFYPYSREPWHWEYNPPARRAGRA